MHKKFVTIIFLLFSSMSFASDDIGSFDIDGNLVKLSDYKGKWVLVNYWAAWCSHCVEEFPTLNEFHNKHKDNAAVLGVNFDGLNETKLQRAREIYSLKFPLLKSNILANKLSGAFKGLPATVIINPKGEVVSVMYGGKSLSQLEREIRKKS